MMLASIPIPDVPTSPLIGASVFDIFKIGVGPSSSHTMGPMTAAADFVARLLAGGVLRNVARVQVNLYGSLALTGKGHATDRALLLGLSGERPSLLDPDRSDATVTEIRERARLQLAGVQPIDFIESSDIAYLGRERLAYHSNALRFFAYDEAGAQIAGKLCYSVGGGAVVDEDRTAGHVPLGCEAEPAFPFGSAAELLQTAETAHLTIAELAWANECTVIGGSAVREGLAGIRTAMNGCIDRGLRQGGDLPGSLGVRRRARDMLATINRRAERGISDPLVALDWVTVWALAVNEENAAGGRVVTAPTNGAAGIVPAVLRYYAEFVPTATKAGQDAFLLTAAVIGSLFKRNASISGAEVGCQGEVGVACSMAAAGLAAALGASNAQIENAAEIGMEHNLGLTCDPLAGLVQVPCIERNAVGAVKAIEAARLAMLGDGTHRVSLDQVIETMLQTGADMSERYKETSLGGLAVSVVEC